MYEYTDVIIHYLDGQYIEMFSKLKSLLFFDELNVMEAVTSLFRDLHILVREAYLKLASHTYDEYVNNKMRELDEQWVDAVLDAYDPTTKYVFSHEEERKAGRLMEALVASSTKAKEIDTALRYWSLMSREYAVRITDKAVMQAYNDDGEDYWEWVTEKDESVCLVCESRDGKIYESDMYPPKPHIGCRCHPKPVR